MTATYSEINMAAFEYKNPTRNKNGGMNGYINGSKMDRNSPRFQLAEKMRVPFGIREASLDDKAGTNPRKNM